MVSSLYICTPMKTSFINIYFCTPIMKKLIGLLLMLASLNTNASSITTTREKEEKMTAYLMVYHKDKDHGLHMAYSKDGYEWIALNDDKPVIGGDSIAEQHGIRVDNFRRKPMNFGFVETKDFFTYHPIGYFDEKGNGMTRTNFEEQKHGAVTYITEKELKMLKKYWEKK